MPRRLKLYFRLRITWFGLVIGLVFFLPFTAVAATAHTLTTIFAQNNYASGNMFNITVQSKDSVMITAFDVNLSRFSTAQTGIYIYYRDGGYEGYETEPSQWTLADFSYVTPVGVDQPTHIPIDGLVLLSGHTYGFYFSISEHDTNPIRMNYTQGSGEYEDENILIACGVGTGWPLFSDVFNPRIWNGTVYYTSNKEVPQTGDMLGHYLWLYAGAAVLSASVLLSWSIQRHTRRVRKPK